MKKFRNLTLITFLILTITLPVKANSSKAINNNPNFIIEDVSKEDFLKARAIDEGITIEKAKIRDNEANKKYYEEYKKNHPIKRLGASYSVLRTGHPVITEKKITQIFTYPGNSNFEAQQSAYIKIWSDGSYRQINECWTHYTRRKSGLYSCLWHENATKVDTDTGTFPCCNLTLKADGYFSFEINTSVNAGFTLPGFSCGITTGGVDTFLSEDMFMSTYFSVY